MGNMAQTADGTPIFASDYTETQWDQYKATSPELVMPCCRADAVLKTSPNGLPFFAHASDECATSPESIWHQQAKELLVQSVRQLGIQAELEVSGTSDSGRWVADVYFEYQGNPFVFEIQHSYQHLRDYRARQRRYEEAGVRAFWVLYKPRFLTLGKSIMKDRYKYEFGNQMPASQDVISGMNQTYDLPIVWLEPDLPEPIRTPGMFSAQVTAWVQAVIDGRFQYAVDGWKIRE